MIMMHVERILVPADGSAESEAAFAWACDLAILWISPSWEVWAFLADRKSRNNSIMNRGR